ncbi:MAG: GDYXXLXY domain-containing protein [Cyanobacteria bacterium P01_E01_bin.34]
MNAPLSRNRWSRAFALAVVAQVGIVLAIPLPKALTLATGTSIFLETRPIDPYDPLRGRYVTLDYFLEDPPSIETIPGYLSIDEIEVTFEQMPDRIYFIMEPRDPTAPESSEPNPVIAWEAVEITYRLPEELEQGQQVLAGELKVSHYNVWHAAIDLGLDSYFIPETIGDELEDDIRRHRENTLVEVKVDRRGNSALVGVWVEDRQY